MPSSVRRSIEGFLFAPMVPLPLIVLRIGVCVVLLLQAAYLTYFLGDLYGSSALLGLRQVANVGLNVGSWIFLFSQMGIAEATALNVLSLLYLTSLIALLIGKRAQLCALGAWFFHLILMDDQITVYGTDFLAHAALFFLIWMPSGEVVESWRARLSLRVFQIYLCMVYLACGIEKMAGTQWWDGEAIWRSTMLPSLAQWDMSWTAAYPWVPKLAGWGTLIIETGYAVFIWPRATRYVWVALTVLLHAGIAMFLGLWLFSLLMIVFTVSVFAIPAERGSLQWPVRGRPKLVPA